MTLHLLYRLAPAEEELDLVRRLFEKPEATADWTRVFSPETPHKSAYRLHLVKALLGDAPDTPERAPFGPLKERQDWAQHFVERGYLFSAMSVLADPSPRPRRCKDWRRGRKQKA